MTQEDKCRRQAKVFLKRINEARAFFVAHKPSIGHAGEHLLRQSLRSLMPQPYGVCQGFVTYKDELSRQCDVIIYKKSESAIKKSYGDLKVVQAESVVSVIEVKSSISKETFRSTLSAFEELKKLQVTNCFLFVYDRLTCRSLRKWLLGYKFPPKCTEEFIVTDCNQFDWPDKEWLPNAILTLDANKFYSLSHISAYDGDRFGYARRI